MGGLASLTTESITLNCDKCKEIILLEYTIAITEIKILDKAA